MHTADQAIQRLDQTACDIVGDVHGCFEELQALLETLGHRVEQREGRWRLSHPEGRRLVFVGDFVDRGPGIAETLAFVQETVEAGESWSVLGNHERKLMRLLAGRAVQLTHGLDRTWAALEGWSSDRRDRLGAFLARLPLQLFIGDALLVVHAGLPERLHGRVGDEAAAHALFGATNGQRDAHGFPVRLPWADAYAGARAVVYGHTPLCESVWINNTICVDTGCVFGGRLTALRWPERTLHAVEARGTWAPGILR